MARLDQPKATEPPRAFPTVDDIVDDIYQMVRKGLGDDHQPPVRRLTQGQTAD